MLRTAFVLFSFVVFGANCDYYSNVLRQGPFVQTWQFNDPSTQPRASFEPDVENVGRKEKEREELGPDYKDPVGAGTEQKPVLNPKPHDAQPPTVEPLPDNNRPINLPLPGGVVDVDTDGFGQLPQIPEFINPADFDLNNFGLGTKPGSLFGFGGLFGPETAPWWKGPNVCVERSESTDDEDEKNEKKNDTEVEGDSARNFFSTSIRFSNCQEMYNKYECVTKFNNHGVFKTFTVSYKCCYGFRRERGQPGCTKQMELKSLMNVLEDLGIKEFKKMIEDSGLAEKFNTENMTVFAPTESAMDAYNSNIEDTNSLDADRRRRGMRNTLSSKDFVLSHAVAGLVDLTELDNEDLIYSENNNNSLRINIYPTQTYDRMITVNCARVKKMNNFAKNGITHMTEDVIVPATETIEDILRSHPRLTSFKKVFDVTNIKKHMKVDGHYTVFAPTDQAFNKLDEFQKQQILNGNACAPSIIKHHITAHTICSSAIIDNSSTHNVEGDVLNMERTEDDVLLFEGKAKIIETDIMATNGVIHLIDEVIIPDSALYIGNVLKTQNFTKFKDLIERAGLTEDIDNLSNATLFVPSDEAFEKPEAKKLLDDAANDQEKLRDIVMYHTTKGKLQSSEMKNNQKIETNNGNNLRINLYSTRPLFTNIVNRATANCARLIGFDEKVCGSTVHEVNSILVPPTKNILDIINDNEKYRTLSSIIKGTEVEDILQQRNNSITFLAPTDESFAALDEQDLKKLREDKDKANEVLKGHILTEILCCSGVGPHNWGFNSFVPTLSRNHYEIGRTGSQVRIHSAIVTSCDNLATNGIVHTINKVLLPRRQHVPSSIGGGFFLFDI